MGWQDRDYNQYGGGGGGGGGDAFRRVGGFLNQSFPIGTYVGIAVRVHITFFLLVGFRLLFGLDDMDHIFWILRWTSLLFLSVLLHEFGHCFGCRAVGGSANNILMWPLGGLAFCAPPKRPWPEFVTVACGPLVNVVIFGACYLSLFVMMPENMPVSFDPFGEMGPWRRFVSGIPGLLADLFVVNYVLFLFNLALVFYPFDGGRLVQIALWKKFGYGKSMFIATRVGMGGAVLVALFGLAKGNLMLVFIGGFGFYTCYQQAKFLKAEGAGLYDAAYENVSYSGGRASQPGFFERMRQKRANEKARRQQDEKRRREAEVDRILAKVKNSGLQSLTEKEKRTLQQETDRQQKAG